jgi:hypothetical protein
MVYAIITEPNIPFKLYFTNYQIQELRYESKINTIGIYEEFIIKLNKAFTFQNITVFDIKMIVVPDYMEKVAFQKNIERDNGDIVRDILNAI